MQPLVFTTLATWSQKGFVGIRRKQLKHGKRRCLERRVNFFTFLDFLQIILETIVATSQRVVFQVQLGDRYQTAITLTKVNYHREPSKHVLDEYGDLQGFIEIPQGDRIDSES